MHAPDRLERPIRVVMFGSGPRLTADAREFLLRLETHPEVMLLGAFCQSASQSVGAIAADLWKRRGILGIPLFLAWLFGEISPYIRNPQSARRQRRRFVEIGNRIRFVPDIHADNVLAQVASLQPDLGLIYGSPILKPQLFEIPKFGTLGIHHGKVPEYRGNKTMFWAMYNGEEAAGVTIQKVNAGLDTGESVKEGEVRIARRSQRKVWQELEALGLRLYLEAILEVKNGTAQFRPQTGIKGKLYRNPKVSDILRFWGRQLKRRLRLA